MRCVFKVMTPEDGDKPETFDTADAVEISKAETRFKELTGKGFAAFGRDTPDSDKHRRLDSFDPNVAETVFTPQKVGG